jgi:hypothetical protein
MNEQAKAEIEVRFRNADADPAIRRIRLGVLIAAAPCLQRSGDILHSTGFVLRDDVALASALLCHIAAELVGGIQALLESGRVYAAAALLRQLVEVEYLAYLGYSTPARLAEWYRSPPEQLRVEFTPKRMREASDGLFADHEYWTHCKHGGHPHPSGRMLLQAYKNQLPPSAHLTPDTCHHLHRLWTSVRMAHEQQGRTEAVRHEPAAHLTSAIEAGNRPKTSGSSPSMGFRVPVPDRRHLRENWLTMLATDGHATVVAAVEAHVGPVSYGSGMLRSRQIFRARMSLTSEWRGTTELLRVVRFTKTEWFAPSRSSTHPCCSRCCTNSRRFTH